MHMDQTAREIIEALHMKKNHEHCISIHLSTCTIVKSVSSKYVANTSSVRKGVHFLYLSLPVHNKPISCSFSTCPVYLLVLCCCLFALLYDEEHLKRIIQIRAISKMQFLFLQELCLFSIYNFLAVLQGSIQILYYSLKNYSTLLTLSLPCH